MQFDLESIKEERAFLHDLSSPLMVAMGMVDFVSKKIPNETEADEVNKVKMEKAKKALDKLATLLKDRRALLITRMPDTEDG